MAPIRIHKMIRHIRTSKGEITYTIPDLLKEIQERPVTWLNIHIDYRNSGVKENAWDDICRVFVPYFDELKEDEQKRIKKLYRKNWKTVITKLMESVREQSLPNKKRIRPYHYARHLEFYLKTKNLELEKVFDKKELEKLDKIELAQRRDYELKRANQPVDDIVKQLRRDLGDDTDENAVSSSKNARTENVTPINISAVNENDIIYENYDTDESQYDVCTQQQQTIITIPQPVVNPTLTSNNGKVTNDPDQAFFDSVKPTLRKLTEPQKLEFKIGVLEILRKYQNT